MEINFFFLSTNECLPSRGGLSTWHPRVEDLFFELAWQITLATARGAKTTEPTTGCIPQGKSSCMEVMIVKERMRDRVAMPRVETLQEKTALK